MTSNAEKIITNDATLVKSYIDGEESAISLLIERHQTKIYGFIYSKIPDQEIADDVFQDTFIKVIRKLKSRNYNEEGKFLSWVIRIAHNLIIDHFRNNKKMPMQHDTEGFSVFSVLQDNDPNIELQLMGFQIESDLRKLVEQLPEDQKQVLMMRIYQDMSFKEISEQTGVSINTALGRMRYALINLRKIIKKNKLSLSL